jgi:hypothetical protein
VNQAKYIGMDVHQATISVAVMDSAGPVLAALANYKFLSPIGLGRLSIFLGF